MGMRKIAEFSDRLNEALLESGMSATELSVKIGLSKQAISMYASGSRHPKQPTIEAIARTLNINPMWLIGFDTEKYMKQSLKEEKAAPFSSDISEEINGVLEKLVTQPEGLMFCGKPMDDETKHLLKLSLEHAMKLAIEMDKNKTN